MSRFSFGKNWKSYLQLLTPERIDTAKESLLSALQKPTLKGLTFLDIGCGSGLFSLAAHQAGARVISFDYDEDCVQCALSLKEQYGATDWTITQGSVLDTAFLQTLPSADIVYSWGVLHHTGDMYKAFDNVVPLVKEGGLLFISIYNDQGRRSRMWTWIKKTYNTSGMIGKKCLLGYGALMCWMPRVMFDVVQGKNPLTYWKTYKKNRGMSPYYDLVDWVGGFPFEVAKPEVVFNFFKEKNCLLQHLKTCSGGGGCNELIFWRAPSHSAQALAQ